MKRTDWYSGDQKPARIGVYERVSLLGSAYSFWDGEVWCAMAPDPDEARRDCGSRSIFQDVSWRGLAQNPEAAC